METNSVTKGHSLTGKGKRRQVRTQKQTERVRATHFMEHTDGRAKSAHRATAKGEQLTVGVYGVDEVLKELVDISLDGKLLHPEEELDSEIEETVQEGDNEA